MSFRVQGIPEDPYKTRDQIFVPTYEHVSHILKTLGMEAEIVNLRWLGKLQKERPKPRAVLVTLPSATAVKLVRVKSLQRQQELKDLNVFVSRTLSIKDSCNKNICLKKRKELIEQGVERDKLKIRNFTKYNDGIEVPLSHLQILQFNARSLVDCQRRFKMSNAINFGSYNVICIRETWLNQGIPDS